MLNFVPYFKAMIGSKLSNENGQGMVEYVLIIALIAIFVIGAINILGGGIGEVFTNIGETLSGSVPAE